jgi:alkylation response protein AidB-like acyl-CoA dehydrogenase
VLLDLSEDQSFFRETSSRFLDELASPAEVRLLRGDPAGYQDEYWRRGAELGWVSLLVDEANGGGTISDAGLVDLSLIAHEFGRHAAPGPLITTNVVAATLNAHCDPQHDVLSGLLSGSVIASWCAPERSWDDGQWRPGVHVREIDSFIELSGEVHTVEAAPQSDHFLVTAGSEDGLTQVLVPAGTAGLSISPMQSVDLTRRFGIVTFEDVRLSASSVVGAVGEAGPDVERQYHTTLALLNAEAVGAMQAAFDMTVVWAFDRYSFGRPLASYQALKHRFADMLSWLEAAHAISDAACLAIHSGAPNTSELVSAAKAFIGAYGTELLQDCVQLHGGIGVTFEHDLHLFLRRVTVNSALLGTPADHRRRVAQILDARSTAA